MALYYPNLCGMFHIFGSDSVMIHTIWQQQSQGSCFINAGKGVRVLCRPITVGGSKFLYLFGIKFRTYLLYCNIHGVLFFARVGYLYQWE